MMEAASPVFKLSMAYVVCTYLHKYIRCVFVVSGIRLHPIIILFTPHFLGSNYKLMHVSSKIKCHKCTSGPNEKSVHERINCDVICLCQETFESYPDLENDRY